MGAMCMMFGHRRDQHRVWHDGENFRAPCARCGIPMIKPVLDKWRPFDSVTDLSERGAARKARPDRV
jgi:hypothetical protein